MGCWPMEETRNLNICYTVLNHYYRVDSSTASLRCIDIATVAVSEVSAATFQGFLFVQSKNVDLMKWMMQRSTRTRLINKQGKTSFLIAISVAHSGFERPSSKRSNRYRVGLYILLDG